MSRTRVEPVLDQALLSSALFMAERGFSANAIQKVTGLSYHQIYYRTGKFGVSLKSFRNGESELAQELMAKTECAKHGLKATPGVAYKVARGA